MIYFDNAATTMQKPPEVVQAITQALAGFGGPGRSSHAAARAAGLSVWRAREAIAKLFNAPDPSRVAFTLNATDALNAVVAGLVAPGSHAVTTAASHNSVLRPLFREQDAGRADVNVVPISPDGILDLDAFDAAFTPATTLAIVTHASNVTGDVYDITQMAEIAHAHNALICVDAAQTAGVIPIDMVADNIDIVCFTGHKSLYGPQGTGGMVVLPHVDIPSYRVGGTGLKSYDRAQPDSWPDRLEAGTQNAHGLAGLCAGVTHVLDVGCETIGKQVTDLTQRFEAGVSAIDDITVYAGHGGIARTGAVALNVGDADSSEIANILDAEYGICVRAGAHCAPLMHDAIGTADRGCVRFSFSHFNTPEEIDAGITALAEIAQELGAGENA